jgi:hypothetical protein
MARPLQLGTRQAINAAQTLEAFLFLVTLRHGSFDDDIRVCNDGQDLTSRGLPFLRFPFEIVMPPESDEAPPRVTLRICNVDRRIVEAVRSVPDGAITVILELVLSGDPDQVEAGPFEFTLRKATYDALVVEGELRYEDLLSEPYPADKFDPGRTPGIF